MKKFVSIFVVSFFVLSFSTFSQTKLKIEIPAVDNGDVIIKPLGATGHQGLIFSIPFTGNGTNYFSFGDGSNSWMSIFDDRTVKIDGKLYATEIEVTSDVWSDFVFKPEYNLMPLNELEEFIKTNNHLPNIPTETEVKANGINVAEMNAKLLQKVEELTIYMIQLKKENDILKQNFQNLQVKTK